MSDQISSGKGSLLGGLLLVAGSAIGAGMLGIPLVTGVYGFLPSLVVFFFCWIFMSSTALLLLEANLFAGKDSNIITMAEKSLGVFGKFVSFSVYLFLIYSMLVAYVDASGGIIKDFVFQKFNMIVSPSWGSVIFTFLFGFCIFLGTFVVDRLNRLLMLGLIITYVAVIFMGKNYIHSDFLQHRAWKFSLLAIPVVITSFGYHNVIPTLTSYLKGNRRKMIAVVLLGGAIPLIIYILWEVLILGVVPYSFFAKSPTFEKVISFIPYRSITLWVQYFAFFAIVTSFLAQALALLDFLRDALRLKKNLSTRFGLLFLVLLPPLALALTFPGIFIKALGLVGGFAAIILFALIPTFMVWDLRYKRKDKKNRIVPGGKFILILIICISLGIMTIEFIQEFVNPLTQ